MDYIAHYEKLIERAKNRILDIETETHHIIPKCMGGSDNKSNLVELTPEEHYVAHQLLIKIYPDNQRLIHAAIMMTVSSGRHGRSKNKLYGWLRRKHSELIKTTQSGKGNSQFGTIWICNVELNISKKIKANDLPLYSNNGWMRGRNLKKKKCESCGREFVIHNLSIKSCSKECEHNIRSSAAGHWLRRGVLCGDIEFESLSKAAQYFKIDIETVRYRIGIGKYRYIN